MKANKSWILPLLLILTLLLVACGGAAPAADATPVPATAAADGGDSGDDAEPTAAADDGDDAEATAEPTEEVAQEEPTEEATDEATPEATEEATDDSGSNSGSAGAITGLAAADDINSYRFNAVIVAEGDAFATDEDLAMMGDGITIAGAIVKDPPAQDLIVELGAMGTIGYRQIGEDAYLNFGGMWSATTPDDAISVDDLAPITAEDLEEDLGRMEEVGEEEVNGRDTIHYMADRDLLAEISEEQGDESFNFAEADDAQLDVWIDQEYNFLVKMELTAEGAGMSTDNPDAEGRIEFLIEYLDFNADDIVIEAPEDVDMDLGTDDGSTGTDDGSTGTDDGSTGGDDSSMDATDLPTLLGFDLGLPADSEVDVSFGIATISVPLSFEETLAVIQESFEGAGYTLNEDESFADFGILTFNGEKTWSVSVTEDTADQTDVFMYEVEE